MEATQVEMMMAVERCPVCGHGAGSDAAAGEALALDQAPVQCTVYRCRSCGLRWLEPYPVCDDFRSIYGSDYYEAEQEAGPSYRDTQVELAPCYAQIAGRFRALGIVEGLLDVGCGTGDFLRAAAEIGIAGEGIDPSSYAVEQARVAGLAVTEETLSEVVDRGRTFRAAHCSHVLEHTADAHAFLEQLNACLEPNAPVYLEVPVQFDGVLDRVNRLRGLRRAYSEYSIHHHYFFTPAALTKLLRSHGFVILSLTTFLPCRRAVRRAGPRKWLLQSMLWLGDRLGHRGDVISVWARRER